VQIFLDVDSIELGLDFVGVLKEWLAGCVAMLVVIGPRWLSVADSSSRRRIDDPQDIVRLEVETALNRDIRVIPVLVNGARLPKSADLPESLKSLAQRSGCEISHNRFESDILGLFDTLERALGTSSP
jgi:hypothetical protein